MNNILCLNKISKSGTKLLDPAKYAFGDSVENPAAVLVRSASMHEMELPASVLAVARAGAGVNNIPTADYAAKGVVVFNTPGANANAVKELVLLGLLMASRKIADSLAWVNTLKSEGDAVGKLVEKGKSAFAGPEIYGKKLGVVGLGAIGALVCNAAVELGMEVYGYDPYISVDAAWGLSSHVIHAKDLGEIYKNCDYITLHVPANAETKGMVNADTLAQMKDDVRILNFARGELVDTAAMLTALDNGKAGAYVTDFPNADLIGQPGVTCLPHLGASTPESEDNCARMAVQQVIDYLENGNIRNSVNLPAAVMERSGDTRVCVIHRNIAGILSKISTAVADTGLNIENMLNKSKGDFAYTMLDTMGAVSKDALDKITAVDGIISVRVITK